MFSTGMVAGLAGLGAATAGIGAGLGIAGLGILKVTEKASHLNEIVNQSKIIFGGSADSVLAWSRTSVRAMGLTQVQALEAATNLGDMLLQLGLAPAKATKMSTSMVQLAADLASFKDVDTSQVLDAQAAAFRGEYDALQRFIPGINAARVEQVALTTTGKDNVKQLTLADKALAVNTIMFKDGARAVGDFKRTSTGMAGQQKILRAQWEELQTTLGQKFLPVVTKIVTFLNSLFNPTVGKTGGMVRNLSEWFGKAKEFGARLSTWWTKDLQPALVRAKDDILPALISFWKQVSWAFRTNSGDGAKFHTTVAALGKFFTSVLIPILSILFRVYLQNLKITFIAIGLVLKQIVIPALRGLMTVAINVIGTILTAAVKGFGWIPGLGGKLKNAKRDFDEFAGGVRRALGGIPDEPVKVTATAVITGDVWRLKQPGGTLGRPMRAQGGSILGLGTETSDSIPLMGSHNEHVVSAREVRGAGGHRALESIRAQWRHMAGGGPLVNVVGNIAPLKRGVNALNTQMDGIARAWGAQLRKDFAPLWASGASNPGLDGALAWARSQAGKPYIWGGVGPRGYDCSGFQSAITNAIQGRSLYSRRGSTGTMPWSGFAPGYGAYSIGSRRGNPGHMAGTINGVNVESNGSQGVVVGRGARGANSSLFTGVWHLKGFAQGGAIREGDAPFDLLDPRGKAYRPRYREPEKIFDRGGWMPPGSRGVNLSRRPEAVLTEAQLGAMAGGDTFVFQNHGVITTQDAEDWFATMANRAASRRRI
jgi:hypothetical protein